MSTQRVMVEGHYSHGRKTAIMVRNGRISQRQAKMAIKRLGLHEKDYLLLAPSERYDGEIAIYRGDVFVGNVLRGNTA